MPVPDFMRLATKNDDTYENPRGPTLSWKIQWTWAKRSIDSIPKVRTAIYSLAVMTFLTVRAVEMGDTRVHIVRAKNPKSQVRNISITTAELFNRIYTYVYISRASYHTAELSWWSRKYQWSCTSHCTLIKRVYTYSLSPSIPYSFSPWILLWTIRRL